MVRGTCSSDSTSIDLSPDSGLRAANLPSQAGGRAPIPWRLHHLAGECFRGSALSGADDCYGDISITPVAGIGRVLGHKGSRERERGLMIGFGVNPEHQEPARRVCLLLVCRPRGHAGATPASWVPGSEAEAPGRRGPAGQRPQHSCKGQRCALLVLVLRRASFTHKRAGSLSASVEMLEPRPDQRPAFA
jgi:hypothetical protein